MRPSWQPLPDNKAAQHAAAADLAGDESFLARYLPAPDDLVAAPQKMWRSKGVVHGSPTCLGLDSRHTSFVAAPLDVVAGSDAICVDCHSAWQWWAVAVRYVRPLLEAADVYVADPLGSLAPACWRSVCEQLGKPWDKVNVGGELIRAADVLRGRRRAGGTLVPNCVCPSANPEHFCESVAAHLRDDLVELVTTATSARLGERQLAEIATWLVALRDPLITETTLKGQALRHLTAAVLYQQPTADIDALKARVIKHYPIWSRLSARKALRVLGARLGEASDLATDELFGMEPVVVSLPLVHAGDGFRRDVVLAHARTLTDHTTSAVPVVVLEVAPIIAEALGHHEDESFGALIGRLRAQRPVN